MIQTLCRWLLYTVMGWKTRITEAHPAKYIICLAPHTSNWDFIIGLLYSRAEKLRINFLMKKEWFFWPLGLWFKHLGGIPVYRSKHTRMTDSMAEAAIAHEEFRLCITPEGTRSLNPDWKKGFYYIAQKAEMPILLYGLDYKRRLIDCSKTIVPSGNIEDDMKEIKRYFNQFTGKHPEKFTTGEI